jgi:hypothetical protein
MFNERCSKEIKINSQCENERVVQANMQTYVDIKTHFVAFRVN